MDLAKDIMETVARVNSISSELEDIRTDLRIIRNSPHECRKQEIIEKIEKDSSSMDKLFKRSLIGALSFLLIFGTGAVYQYVSLKETIEATSEDVNSIKNELKEKETSSQMYENLRRILQENKK